MRWYYAEDVKYYQGLEDIKKRSGYEELLVCPSEEEIRKFLREGRVFACIAPYLPSQQFRALFSVEELPNEHGLLTTQDMRHLSGLSEEERRRQELTLIEKKIGLKIYRPVVNREMLVGLSNIKRFILGIKEIRDPRLRPKGIFLVGLPGTGKSFSAKYASSELDAFLVELNLSRIMESPNPTFLLHSVFSYLEKASQSMRFVIWIDEIEKMFSGEVEVERKVLGQLLTILNDMNTPGGYQINGIFWATANDISGIVERNPEFLRKGRFDELFFIDSPYEEQAKQIVRVYENYYGVKYVNLGDMKRSLSEDLVSFVQNKVYVFDTLTTGSQDASRFIYVPSEIEQIVKELARRGHFNRKMLNGAGDELFEMLYPVSATTKLRDILLRIYSVRPDELRAYAYERVKKALLLGKEVTDLDLLVVLAQMEPMALSMQAALSRLRSNERFFIKAD